MVVADIEPFADPRSTSRSSPWETGRGMGLFKWNSEEVYEWLESVIAEHMVSFFIAAMVGVGFGGMFWGGSVWCGVRLVVKTLVFGWLACRGLYFVARWMLSTRRERNWWLWT